jgi:hypothetical protein
MMAWVNRSRYQGGGCLLDPELIDVGQAYLIESVLSFILLSAYLLNIHVTC